MQKLHQGVLKEFEKFTEVQLPALDDVVHKHIDILRVSEQDHYNKLKNILGNAVESRSEMAEDMEEIKDNLENMKSISDTIANTITTTTLSQLSQASRSFEKEILSLKSHAEGVKTSLSESETTLDTIREKSELIMKQMVLSSKKMDGLEVQNNGLHNIYTSIKELMQEVEVIKSDYVKSQSQLSLLAREFDLSDKEQIDAMKNQIENLGETLTTKIDESLEKLHEHYHIAGDDITQSVQILSKKAQLQKGYAQTNS